MNKFKKFATYTGSLLAVFALSPLKALAVGVGLNIDLRNVDSKYNSITSLDAAGMITLAVKVLLGSAGIVAFFMLLWGGIQWIVSGGDKEGTEKARKRITGALIGLAIVFSAYALLYLVSGIFGVNNILTVNF